MVDTITKGVVKDMLKNPYYLFENTKATPVIFYELDSRETTLDDSTRMEFEQVGAHSPLRFKKIYDVYLYGLERIEIHYSNGENGLEADPVQGDCTDLPNTINPTPGCYFEIPYLNNDQKHYLFQITDVSDDTMDDGNNIHKMSYELDMTDSGNWNHLQKQIVEEYKFIPSNVGTKDNSIVLSSKYDLAEKLDEIDTILRQYYKELFYNDRVQTFTFDLLTEYHINDSMVIEFIIKHSLMSGTGQDYMYVSHKNPIPKTFSIDYADSIYRCIETGDKEGILTANNVGVYRIIDNMTTIFTTRQESYYTVKYNEAFTMQSSRSLETFDHDFLHCIYDNVLYTYDQYNAYLNIVIKFMNGMIPVSDADIEALEQIEYTASQQLYYTLPIVIYCVERYIKSLIST
jgi:hypothetical protein